MVNLTKWLWNRKGGAEASPFEDIKLVLAGLQCMAVAVFVLDREGKVILWNDACHHLTGMPAEKVLGTKDQWKALYPAPRPTLADVVLGGGSSDMTALYAASKDVAGAPKGNKHAENWCNLPRGVRLYLAFDACPIFDDKGEICAVIETLQDFTIVKNSELAVEAERAEEARRLEMLRTELGKGLERLAAGDLVSRIEQPFYAGADNLRLSLNSAVEEIRQTLVTIVGSARGLRAGIDEIAETSIQLASKTTRQVADLENAFTTLKEITATVQDTAVGTDHARTIVAAAKNDAEQNNIIVRDAIDAINCIDKSSKQIGQIIGVIDEIAFQTNLLALNAGVEAARAGEAGRGFAVVASEVRSLAQRSTKAAKEIKQLIQASASQVDQGVDLVVRAGNALEHIASQVSEINVVVSRIAAGAQEQAAGLKQLNGSVNQINEITRVNAEMVQQSTNSARSLSEETSGLMSLVNRFELGEVVNRKQIPKGSNSVYRVKALKTGLGLAEEGAARWRS